MTTHKRFALIQGLLIALLSLSAIAAFADPPGRAVRLKYISGEVSIQPGGVNDWVAATINRPLTTADRVWTDKNARAELHLGSGALRLNAETSMTLTNVSDDIVQVELDQGTLNLHVRHLFDGETYEIDTPNLAFTIVKGGDYRFDVDPNADTTYVTVWHGEGEANGQGPGVKLHSGEQASFKNATSLEHDTYHAPDRDGFDDWCRVRNDREDHAESYRYVSADVVGAEDLDDYGSWRVVGAYGPVWVPAVAPGWAPYHYGHWVWVEPWGWTWVDDAPWGFAPCHYGRWVYTDGFWGWAPGPVIVARPVYAPALVAWVGGPHFGMTVAFGEGGGVGWFPLGYGEPYVPAYTVSRTYFQQVNVTNTHITNITNVTNNYYITNNNTTVVNNNINNIRYVNRTVPGAMTAVPNRTLTNSEPVARAAVNVPANELHAATVASAAPVAPVRSSVLGVNAGARTAAPPAQAQVAPRPVVSRVAPPPRPVPFEARQEVLAKNPGRPLDPQAEATLRTAVTRNAGAPMPVAQPGKPMSPATPVTAPVARPATPTVTATQPATPTRVVPRPPQPGNSTTTESLRTQPNAPVAMPHPQPGTTAAPVAGAPPTHVVPHPPQVGGTASPVSSGTIAAPRQPQRVPVTDLPPTTDVPHPATTNVPRPPTTQNQRTMPTERTTPTQRAPEVTEPARPIAHTDNAPRASAEPRPQPPRPLYQPQPPHNDQRPPERPQTQSPSRGVQEHAPSRTDHNPSR